ncbi:phage holin family protein [Winogradskyella vidalii]|uniref:phage holin family protein n=1 Tax=Winogradskyella vidalii TaxID=2615024 RepID=UPI0015CBD178|nr:phage holin family protein [Winogradskyella vidalii]
MSVFEDLKHTTEKTSDIGERYVRASHQYFRLKVFQQLTISLSMAAKVLVVGTLLFGGLVFLSIAGAIELGNALNSYSLGFLMVGLIYLVIALICYLLRKKFNAFIIKKVGLKFFN